MAFTVFMTQKMDRLFSLNSFNILGRPPSAEASVRLRPACCARPRPTMVQPLGLGLGSTRLNDPGCNEVGLRGRWPLGGGGCTWSKLCPDFFFFF